MNQWAMINSLVSGETIVLKRDCFPEGSGQAQLLAMTLSSKVKAGGGRG